jgi:hypothetical protein
MQIPRHRKKWTKLRYSLLLSTKATSGYLCRLNVISIALNPSYLLIDKEKHNLSMEPYRNTYILLWKSIIHFVIVITPYIRILEFDEEGGMSHSVSDLSCSNSVNINARGLSRVTVLLPHLSWKIIHFHHILVVSLLSDETELSQVGTDLPQVFYKINYILLYLYL